MDPACARSGRSARGRLTHADAAGCGGCARCCTCSTSRAASATTRAAPRRAIGGCARSACCWRGCEADGGSPLRRTLCAALARAGDALVRDELCELSDILVAVSSTVRAAADLQVLSEASMAPDVKEVFRAAAEVARLVCLGPRRRGRALVPRTPSRALARDPAARDLAARGGAAARAARHGARAPADRRAPLAGRAQALGARRWRSSASRRRSQYGAQLCAGARRRLGLGGGTAVPAAWRALRALDLAVERAMRDLDDDLRAAVRGAVEAVRADLPGGIADVVTRVISRAGAAAPRGLDGHQRRAGRRWRKPRARLRLPPWLPPSRVVGGFYILRPIGTGAGGSVFVAKRSEDRQDDAAETYALKVPSFGGQNAHTLTEDEFMQLFREEAGALLTLPQHANLAGFVTFDARARPKPILVMELVRGTNLERVLDKRELSVPVVFGVLDGIAAGLTAMHAGGIGHLDVKPANIILRETQGGSTSRLLDRPDGADAGAGRLRPRRAQGAARLRQPVLRRARGVGRERLPARQRSGRGRRVRLLLRSPSSCSRASRSSTARRCLRWSPATSPTTATRRRSPACAPIGGWRRWPRSSPRGCCAIRASACRWRRSGTRSGTWRRSCKGSAGPWRPDGGDQAASAIEREGRADRPARGRASR